MKSSSRSASRPKESVTRADRSHRYRRRSATCRAADPSARAGLRRGNAAAAHTGDAATGPAGACDAAWSAGDGAGCAFGPGHAARSTGNRARCTLGPGNATWSAGGGRWRRSGRGAPRPAEVVAPGRTTGREAHGGGKGCGSHGNRGGRRTSEKHRRDFLRVDQHVGRCTTCEVLRNFDSRWQRVTSAGGRARFRTGVRWKSHPHE